VAVRSVANLPPQAAISPFVGTTSASFPFAFLHSTLMRAPVVLVSKPIHSSAGSFQGVGFSSAISQAGVSVPRLSFQDLAWEGPLCRSNLRWCGSIIRKSSPSAAIWCTFLYSPEFPSFSHACRPKRTRNLVLVSGLSFFPPSFWTCLGFFGLDQKRLCLWWEIFPLLLGL